ncbi:MAG: TadE/TadG family type IV pilus assembly protein, partial [Planctomycetota bacterium]
MMTAWLRAAAQRLRGVHRCQSGAMSIVSVFTVLVLVMLMGMVLNVGRATDGKLRMQNAADAAAYSGGVVIARGMNALAFTNHLLCEVFAITAFMREAQEENAASHVPDLLAAWRNVSPAFGRSEFERFRMMHTSGAIQNKTLLEQSLVELFSALMAKQSEDILPTMEAVLAEEMIPQYQRAVVEAFPDIAQTAVMEVSKRNGEPDHGRGPMLGALWRTTGAFVGGDGEAYDPSLPVVDP